MNSLDYAEITRRSLSRCNRWLDSRTGQLCLGIVVAVVYLYAYHNYGARPGASATYPLGWWGWWDQGQYWKCAGSLAQGSLTPETYWYPLGYPVLGALFYRWIPQHAFLIPNLILVVGIAALFFRIARKLVTPTEAVLFMALFVACYRGLLSDSLVVPWNTIPTHFLSYLMILLVGFSPPTRNRLLLAAGCAGAIYLCRPGDAFCMTLLVGIAILRLPSWPERLKIGVIATVSAGFVWALVMGINWKVFHAWTTPYEQAVASSGFGGYPILQKAFWLVVDNRPIFNEPEATLFSHFPWLPLVIPGVVYLLCRRFADISGWLISIAATYAIYFEFNDFWPSNLFRYLLVHYLVWTIPLLGLIAYVGLREAWRSRPTRWGFALMGLVVLTLSLLTTELKVLGQQAALVAPHGVITAGAAEPIDYTLFEGVKSAPKLESGGRVLQPRMDYIQSVRPKGVFVLLAKPVRRAPLAYDATNVGALQKVQYGQLKWHFVSLKEALSALLQRYRGETVRLVSEAKVPGVDLAGPAGVPDGQPDEVIELELSHETLRHITVWDLQTGDGRAHWTSAENPQHWWLIKTSPPARALPKDRAGIRLCLPDFGQLDAAESAILHGLDDHGEVHLRIIIRHQPALPAQ